MSEQVAKNFIKALEKLEAENDLETIVSLFSENCQVSNVVSPKEFRGTDGAREFWMNYRKTFGEIRSRFRNEIITDRGAALEWKTEGTSDSSGSESAGNDEQINYEGVSILEIENDKITRFYAYFNPGKLGRQISEE